MPRFERRQDERRDVQEPDVQETEAVRAFSRDIVDCAIEASRAVFVSPEQQSPSLQRRATSAYGSADTLDQTGLPPSRRINI